MHAEEREPMPDAPQPTDFRPDAYDDGSITTGPIHILRFLGITGPLTFAQARAEFEASWALCEATSVFTDDLALRREPTDEETEAHRRAEAYQQAAFENLLDYRAADLEQADAKARSFMKLVDQGRIGDEQVVAVMSSICDDVRALFDAERAARAQTKADQAGVRP